MASTSTSSTRAPILAALTGVVLLGLVVAFSLGLSAVADDDESVATPAASTEPIELPDVLPGNLVSAISDAMPTTLSDQLGGKEGLGERLDNGAAGMADLYDAPSALGVYGATDGSVFVTVAATASTGQGLFMPDGVPPFDLESLGVTTPPQQVLEAVDGGLCSATFIDPNTGQPLADRTVPSELTCQYTDDVRTYQISGQGLSEQAAVEALKGLSGYLAGDEDAVPDVADLPTVPADPAAPTEPVPSS